MSNAALAQSVERSLCKGEVAGSNPSGQHHVLTAHQPCYFPWLGFWAKLASADRFVIFDNVQFERRGYSNRVQIKTHQGPQWLTIPVEHGKPLLKDARISNDGTLSKHYKTIYLAYKKAPYFEKYIDNLATVLVGPPPRYLADLCERALYFGLEALFGARDIPPILTARDYEFKGEKSALVLDMCKQLGATKYIFGAKGRDYADLDAFKAAGIEVEFQSYRHPIYKQLHGPFVPGLSILDLLFNEGPNSLEILLGTT